MTFLIYAFIYTPLKRRTSLSTIVGAVPGALPPLIGWAAARGTLSGPEPWTLFALMFAAREGTLDTGERDAFEGAASDTSAGSAMDLDEAMSVR